MVTASSECKILDAIPATEVSELLAYTAIFSAKESFFKAAYPQVCRYFGFRAVALLGIDLSRKTLHFEIREHLSDELIPGAEYQVSFGLMSQDHIVTVCKLT